MKDIKESALSNSAGTTTPPEENIQDENQLKMEIPLTEEEQKIQDAKEEFEKAKAEHARKVVEGIHAGYQEAKKLATELSARAAGTWFFEKDLARQMNKDKAVLQKELKWLDQFGFIEVKVNGPSMQVKITRKPEKHM